MVNIGWIMTFVSTAVLLAVGGTVLFQRRLRGKRSGFSLHEKNTMSQELTLATTLTVLGIVFGSDRLIGYSFIGAGIVLSIISMIKSKKLLKK